MQLRLRFWTQALNFIEGLSRLLFTVDHALETAFIDVIKIVIMEELLLAALFQLCPNLPKMLNNAVCRQKVQKTVQLPISSFVLNKTHYF